MNPDMNWPDMNFGYGTSSIQTENTNKWQQLIQATTKMTVTNKMITASSLGSVTQQASGMNHTNYYNELLFMKCTYINHT